ncbi:MAG: carboxymuconolactone decarboxylase family protein [Limnohabitans sp.]
MSTTPTPSQKARADRPDDAVFQAGIETRTQVMGPEFVDRAFGNATEYTMPMQEFITRNAWGNVWQRPGLDLKTRSLVTVAMLAALGKQQELKGHVRGALNNGATPDELREVMLHATVYCGFPTAIEAFRSVAEVVESKA